MSGTEIVLKIFFKVIIGLITVTLFNEFYPEGDHNLFFGIFIGLTLGDFYVRWLMRKFGIR